MCDVGRLFVVALEVNYIYDKRHGREGFLRFNVDYKRLTCFRPPFNIIYIMRIIIAEGEKQPPSVNQYQSYNQRPDLADAMSIPIVNSGT
ncbi:hypothetical protein DA35_13760 [Salmonella enterica subsp. enterica]|nr:hypothetical protein [Salmonella enterica subsp. enterica]